MSRANYRAQAHRPPKIRPPKAGCTPEGDLATITEKSCEKTTYFSTEGYDHIFRNQFPAQIKDPPPLSCESIFFTYLMIFSSSLLISTLQK
jgi:hypothetical protein